MVEEIHIELLEGYREFPNAVGLLKNIIYGLVQTELCWLRAFIDGIKEKGFEHLHADPCVLKRVVNGQVSTN